MIVAKANMARIKARAQFGSVIARAGLTRAEVANAAGVSTRTLDSLARPEHYGREGYTRESTAWKIARGFAGLTSATAETAFDSLFVEEDDATTELSP
jgi:DNA-binding XRE family transcriptional regulator